MNLKRMNGMEIGQWLEVFFEGVRPTFDRYVFNETAQSVSVGTGYIGIVQIANPAVDLDNLWNHVVGEWKLSVLADLLRCLHTRKSEVVQAYLSGNFQTNAEIGDKMGISGSCVSIYWRQAQRDIGRELGSRAVHSIK